MPEVLRQQALDIDFRNPIKEIAAFSASAKGLRKAWPPEAVMMLQERIELSGDYTLVEVYQPITDAHLEGILDAVRNRLLDLVLALEEVEPEVARSDKALGGLPSDEVDRVVSVTIFGNQNVIASGDNISQHVAFQVLTGDIGSLSSRLAQLGVSPADVDDLKDAVALDGPQEQKQFGPRVTHWLGRMLSKGAQGAWDSAKAAAPTLITKALGQFYGWPG